MDVLRRDLVLAMRGLRQAGVAAVVVMLALASAHLGVSTVVHAALPRPRP